MITDLTGVSRLIVKSGEIFLDGVSHTCDIDCRLLTGEHDLVVDGEFDFRNMTPDDYLYVQNHINSVKQSEIDALTVEILETEYKMITGEDL